MPNIMDLLAAGGFWAAFTLYWAHAAAINLTVANAVDTVLAVLRPWLGRTIARAYRKMVVVAFVEAVLQLGCTLLLDIKVITPVMARAPGAHLGVADGTWQTVVYVIQALSLGWLLLTFFRLSIPGLGLSALVRSLDWDAHNPNPPPAGAGFDDYIPPGVRTNESENTRFTTLTFLAPIVAPVLASAAGTLMFLVLGNTYEVGFGVYVLGAFINGLLLFIHYALTWKVIMDALAQVLAQITQVAIQIMDEVGRLGISGAIPGYTKEQLDAKIAPFRVSLESALALIKGKGVAILTASMIFIATAIGFYGNHAVLVAIGLSAIGFFVAVGIDAANTAVGLDYTKNRQRGIIALSAVILLAWAFQAIVECTHSTGPRLTMLLAARHVVFFVGVVLTNWIAWVLIVFILSVSTKLFWDKMPKWIRTVVVSTLVLCGVVLVGSAAGVHLNLGLPPPHGVTVQPPEMLHNTDNANNNRRPAARPSTAPATRPARTPASAPAPARRPARVAPATRVATLEACPTEGLTPRYVAMLRRHHSCQ